MTTSEILKDLSLEKLHIFKQELKEGLSTSYTAEAVNSHNMYIMLVNKEIKVRLKTIFPSLIQSI